MSVGPNGRDPWDAPEFAPIQPEPDWESIQKHEGARLRQMDAENRAAIEADPVLRAQADELFPPWEGPAKEHERLGYPPPSTWPEPEDRGTATLSDLGDVEYVEDLIRPGRIVVWAAEEVRGQDDDGRW